MGWWFKQNPELLNSECEKLGSNGNYKERFRERRNLLISHGEIIVRVDGTTYHPALLIYPESTPYSLPTVLLLDEMLDEDEIIRLSQMNSLQATLEAGKKARFYDYWHQNANGSLCLLEQDNLETYGEFFDVTQVLNRTRDWLAGLKTGNLPPDSPEVEFFAHFRNPNTTKELLVPKSFLDNPNYQGEFFGSLISHVYGESEISKRIFLGIFIQGESETGIRLAQYADFDKMPNGIDTSMDLINKPGVIKSSVEEGKLIEGFWWHVNSSIMPIQNTLEFAELIGDGNKVLGFERMRKILPLPRFHEMPDEVILAIRFKDKQGQNRWQSFSLNKKQEVNTPVVFNSEGIQDYISVFTNYELKAFRGCDYTDARHHLRNKGVAKREILKEKSVSVIGCGALGGEVADCLGKAGTGQITLVDFQRIDIDNTIRHVVGIDKLGLAKAHAVSEHVFSHNPFVKVDIQPLDILTSHINNYLGINSIGISTIANDNVEGYLNEQAILQGRTVFYGRALRGGKTARIFRVIPGVDACFHCLSLYSDEGNDDFTVIPEDETLPTITNECNNPIRPASAADLKLISSLISRVLLKHLQEGQSEHNHWIWSTEEIDDVPLTKVDAYRMIPSTIKPHHLCMYCNPPKSVGVKITEFVLDEMIAETQKEALLETGGVLLGHFKNGEIHITQASGPGPKAKRTATSFEKDISYCQKFINDEFEKHGMKASYVGEWHYHPSPDNSPSQTDLNSLRAIAISEGYLTENPVMIILSNEGQAHTSIHPHLNNYYKTKLTSVTP